MVTEIKLPPLGENLDSGTVLDIKISPGENILEGQTLLEVEAEKATVEVPAPHGRASNRGARQERRPNPGGPDTMPHGGRRRPARTKPRDRTESPDSSPQGEAGTTGQCL